MAAGKRYARQGLYTNIFLFSVILTLLMILCAIFGYNWLHANATSKNINVDIYVKLFNAEIILKKDQDTHINKILNEFSNIACSKTGNGDLCLYFSALKIAGYTTAIFLTIVSISLMTAIMYIAKFIRHSTAFPMSIITNNNDDEHPYMPCPGEPTKNIESVKSVPSIPNRPLNTPTPTPALASFIPHAEMHLLQPMDTPSFIASAPASETQRETELNNCIQSLTWSAILLFLITLLWHAVGSGAPLRFDPIVQRMLNERFPLLEWSLGYSTWIVGSCGILITFCAASARRIMQEVDIPLN